MSIAAVVPAKTADAQHALGAYVNSMQSYAFPCKESIEQDAKKTFGSDYQTKSMCLNKG